MDLSEYDNADDDGVTASNAPESAATSDERVQMNTIPILFWNVEFYFSDILLFINKQDEHGQSVLHFACARSHGRNALIQLIEDSGVSIAYRDELYRTARDVSMQATQPENTREIDKYVLSLAARGWCLFLEKNRKKAILITFNIFYNFKVRWMRLGILSWRAMTT